MASVQETPHSSVSPQPPLNQLPSQETQECFAVMYILENKGLGVLFVLLFVF